MILRQRTRLTLQLVALSTGLCLFIGLVGWSWVEWRLRDQAEESARAIAGVLAQGGFALNETVRLRMQALTGYRFEVDPLGPDQPGSINVSADGRRVRVHYQTEAFQRARQELAVAVSSAVVLGAMAAMAMAWFISRRQAWPFEQLAAAAHRLGAGDWDRPIPLQQANRELLVLSREMEQMRQRLAQLRDAARRDERLSTLGTFTATIAHEVRNPISAVQLGLQLLARQYDGDETIAVIGAELERLELSVEELLAFSCGFDVHPEPCELHSLGQDVCRLLARQAEHAGVALQVEGAALVQADPRRLRQLLLNLVLNGIQAQSEGGRVAIRVQSDGVQIQDHGPGVPSLLRARVFDAFISDRPGGTGLGLHLAEQIARAHDAELLLVPSQQGAVFELRGLPPG
jgi:signal transduction histidine kinase